MAAVYIVSPSFVLSCHACYLHLDGCCCCLTAPHLKRAACWVAELGYKRSSFLDVCKYQRKLSVLLVFWAEWG